MFDFFSNLFSRAVIGLHECGFSRCKRPQELKPFRELPLSARMKARLTNMLAKKPDKHKAICPVHFAYYNLCPMDKSLRLTPAMGAGIADHIWSLQELLG